VGPVAAVVRDGEFGARERLALACGQRHREVRIVGAGSGASTGHTAALALRRASASEVETGAPAVDDFEERRTGESGLPQPLSKRPCALRRLGLLPIVQCERERRYRRRARSETGAGPSPTPSPTARSRNRCSGSPLRGIESLPSASRLLPIALAKGGRTRVCRPPALFAPYHGTRFGHPMTARRLTLSSCSSICVWPGTASACSRGTSSALEGRSTCTRAASPARPSSRGRRRRRAIRGRRAPGAPRRLRRGAGVSDAPAAPTPAPRQSLRPHRGSVGRAGRAGRRARGPDSSSR
jgi:hypothetical protein